MADFKLLLGIQSESAEKVKGPPRNLTATLQSLLLARYLFENISLRLADRHSTTCDHLTFISHSCQEVWVRLLVLIPVPIIWDSIKIFHLQDNVHVCPSQVGISEV